MMLLRNIKISQTILYKQLEKRSSYRSVFLRLSQQTPHKTAEVLYKQILWYFRRQNSFSEHPKNQVFFPLQG